MLSSPFDFAGSLHVGTVIFVSPNEKIKVQLKIDAPESIALNAVTPRLERLIGKILQITGKEIMYQKELLTMPLKMVE